MADHDWIGNAESILALVRAVGGTAEDMERDAPAEEEAVAAVEASLTARLPDALRRTFTEGASRLVVSWHLGTLRPSEPTLRELSEGAMELDVAQLLDLEETRQEWESNAETRVEDLREMRAHGNAESDTEEESASRAANVWRGKLPFLRVSNGDLVAIDLEAPNHPVCYLDHDHEEFHGLRLAPTFTEFMARWSRLGNVGPEW